MRALLALGFALAAVALPVRAQKFPDRPIQMVVPFGPGGTTDIMARLLQEELGKQLGTAIVVVNTAGAGGAIGMTNVARAKPDGYTIAMTTVGPQTLQPARRDTGYTPDSFDYLCGTYDVPVLTLVAADSPFKTLKELIDYGRRNPGKLNYASSGTGTALHISAARLFRHFNVEAVHVPFKSSGEMIVPLKSGQVQLFNETPPVATQYQLRPLLAFSDAPVTGFESVPTARQMKIDIRASVWGGLVAPKGLAADVRAQLEAACKAATGTTLYKARAQAANNPLVYRSAVQFRDFALTEFEQFRRVIREYKLEDK